MVIRKVYGRRMNGYDYIEFMRQFNFKDERGRYIGEFHRPTSIGQRQVGKKKFEGWKYWFDRPYPDDVLDEEILITYSRTLRGNRYTYFYDYVNEFLTSNGFVVLEDRVNEEV